jgi:hypothetical protein
VIVAEPIYELRLEQHLQTWAAWMRGPEVPDGLPTEACGGMDNYSTIDRDSDAAYEKLDFWVAETVNTVINDIGERHPAQKAALYRAYEVVAAFRFPRDSYEAVLSEARQNVLMGLRRRGVWLGE